MAVPLLGGVRRGFRVPVRARKRKAASHEHENGRSTSECSGKRQSEGSETGNDSGRQSRIKGLLARNGFEAGRPSRTLASRPPFARCRGENRWAGKGRSYSIDV